MKKVELSLIDSSVLKLQEDKDGVYFMIGAYRASLPPHAKSKQMSPNDVLVFFLERYDALAVGIISSFIYDWLKNGKAKNVKVEEERVTTEKEIEKAMGEGASGTADAIKGSDDHELTDDELKPDVEG